jgi:hypothetical protein
MSADCPADVATRVHSHCFTAEGATPHVFPLFFDWLSRQSSRNDDVGAFARYALKDKLFPRRKKHLYYVLLRYEGLPALRTQAKRAHAEYRAARKSAIHGAVS